MNDLWFYKWLSGARLLNYRAKIMIMAFIGTHIPLIALASYFAFQSAPDWSAFFTTVGITLAATLIGTGLTLFVLNELLRPVIKTSKALRAYRDARTPSDLPTHFTDEVGTLMSDAQTTISHLESVRDVLEHIDVATGLMNRRSLVQRLEKRSQAGGMFSVGVVRFGNFQRIAGAMNTACAEQAMKIVADRIASAVSVDAQIARIGQSDLAIVLSGLPALEAAKTIEAIISESSQEFLLNDLSLKPELLSGIAVFPTDGSDAVELLDHALAAAANATSALPTVFHSPELRARSIERLQMENELRRALDRQEFQLHYQPVIDLGAQRVRGAEALIRWQHPEKGMMLPGRFIVAAEKSGLIDAIGLWVMREACSQISAWNGQGREKMKVAINLSAGQFLDPDLKTHISQAIDSVRIDPSQLEIELTETAAMADHDHTRRVFTSLRDLGVSIAIDDFGTGYASMSYLRKLPFDKLKIDREFVTDVHQRKDSQAICSAMIALSEGMGLSVLAEGTEKEEEVRFLSGMGCRLFQGYYFAKPMPAHEFGAATDAIALRSLLKKIGPAEQPIPVAQAM